MIERAPLCFKMSERVARREAHCVPIDSAIVSAWVFCIYPNRDYPNRCFCSIDNVHLNRN